jgi:hypothetical protein
MDTEDRLAAVRDSTAWVCASAAHVHLDTARLAALAAEIAGHRSKVELRVDNGTSSDGVGWGEEIHYTGDEAQTVQYLFVVDALNFCFWPSDGQWEYEDLSTAVKRALEADAAALSADRLAAMDEQSLTALLGGKKLPNMIARIEHLRQVGQDLKARWGGSAAELVRSCKGSALRLVDVIVSSFPGFQDHIMYKGRRVCFYKRAQILAGDIWGALKGRGLGEMSDVDKLTMFAGLLSNNSPLRKIKQSAS